jgi:site-specific DNA-methyltransferase (adenine-specific)
VDLGEAQGTGFLNAKQYPLKAHENVLVFCGGTHTYNPHMEPGNPYTVHRKPTASKNYGRCENGSAIENDGFRYPKTVLRFGTEKRGIHPTQKLVALFEYMIRTYTNPGELVLDNCIGSGTTAIAAMNAERDFIGLELDPEYFKTAQQRISGHGHSYRTTDDSTSEAHMTPRQSATLDDLFA